MTTTSRLSLRGMRTFCIAAKYESFRTAADELFITASAVSHQIKNLEQELGQQLFDRNSRALALTDVGRSLFEDAEPMIARLDEIATKYKKGTARSSLRISVQPFFASEMFVPQLNEFAQRHPDIDIHVDTSDEASEKLPANADVSIRLFRAPPQGTSADLLFPLTLVPAGSPAFCDSIQVRKNRIISKFPIIVHDTRSKAWKLWSTQTGIELPDDINVVRLDSMIAVVKAAERGMGAALVPMPLSQEWFDDGKLKRLFDKDLVARDGYYLVCTEERAQEENVRVLREWVLETFADDVAPLRKASR